MIKKIYLLIFICASIFIQAQVPVSVHLSEKEALPDIEFYGVTEDKDGFIWLAANNGLFRYDGKSFEKFTASNKKGLSVFGLKFDSDERLWFNNISGQFYYVENNKVHFFIDLGIQLKGKLSSFIINDVSEKLIVISTKDVYSVDLHTKHVDHVYSNTKTVGLLYFKDNYLIVGSTEQIIVLDEQYKMVLELEIPNQNYININSIIRFFEFNEELYFVQKNGHKSIFFKIDFKTNSVEEVSFFDQLNDLRIIEITNFDKQLWFSTNKGIWVYGDEQNQIQLENQILEDEFVTSVIKDKDQNYWITTLTNGLFILPNVHVKYYPTATQAARISCMDKVNDSTLFFGTNTGDAGFYNIYTGQESILPIANPHRVSAILYNPHKSQSYISKDMGSYVMNNKTNIITRNTTFSSSVKNFSRINDSTVIYSRIQGAMRYKEQNGGVSDLMGKSERSYFTFYSPLQQQSYVAYVDNLVRYDSLWNAKTITNKGIPIFGKSITETSDSITWVASFKEGVFGIKNDSVIYRLTTKEGLTSNRISRINADANMLWIASENSLQVYNSITKEIKTLTKNDGILSYHISGINFFGENVVLASNKGLFCIEKDKVFKEQSADVYFNRVVINGNDTLVASEYKLKHNQNSIKIGFNVNSFLFHQRGRYYYRLKGYERDWVMSEIGENTVTYRSLPAGNYTFQVRPVIENQAKTYAIKELHFSIPKPFWETWWFLLSIVATIVGVVIYYFKRKIKLREAEKEAQLTKISLEKELIATNLIALRSQMNPHFIFNALNSIQDLILKEDTDASYDYIVLFSNLIRNTLSYSNQDFIPIKKEIEFLNVYLELEKLRFGDDLKFKIDSDVKTDDIKVPSLLVQPFIENALVHGLLHKSELKTIQISFKFKNNILTCIIEDNGIGRQRASEIAKRQGKNHQSFALTAIEKRLEIFNKQHQTKVGYTIIDLYQDDKAIGTRVEIIMPFERSY